MAKGKKTAENVEEVAFGHAVPEVLLSDIRPNGTNRAMVKDGAFLELQASIRALGLLEPIGLMKCKTGKAGSYKVIYGRRRLAAVRENGWDKIDSIVFEGLSDEGVRRVQIAENVHRRDLDPIEEGDAYATMVEMDSMTIDLIAAAVSKSESYIRDRLLLTHICEEVRPLVKTGRLPIAHALLIARVGGVKEQKDFAQHAVGFGRKLSASSEEVADLNAASVPYLMPLDKFRDYLKLQMTPLGGCGWPMDEEYSKLRPCKGCPSNSATEVGLFENIPLPGKSAKGNCSDELCYVRKQKLWDRDKAKAPTPADPKKAKAKKAKAAQGGQTPDLYPDPKHEDHANQVFAVAMHEYMTQLVTVVVKGIRKANAKAVGEFLLRLAVADADAFSVTVGYQTQPEATVATNNLVALLKSGRSLAMSKRDTLTAGVGCIKHLQTRKPSSSWHTKDWMAKGDPSWDRITLLEAVAKRFKIAIVAKRPKKTKD